MYIMKLSEIFNSYYQFDQPLNEGGAQGHMAHIVEDPDLTFGDLKKIFTGIFSGDIIIDEKSDGQNLTITYKDGQVLAARNKATLKEPLNIEEVARKFEGRGEIKAAFVNSMKDISNAIKKIPDEDKLKIFGNGKKYLSFEIIYPPTKNIIDYGNRCLIQLHGISVYDDKWNKISEDKEAAELLFNMLKQNDALKQETFEITNANKLKIKNAGTAKKSLEIILAQLDKLVDGLGWGATINDYAKERFEKYIINQAIKADFPINKKTDFVSELADRLSNVSKRRPTKNELSVFAKREGIDIKSEQYKNFIDQLDSTIDEANSVIIRPLEDIVIQAGILLIKNLSGFISADPSKSAKQIAKDLDNAIKEFDQVQDTIDPKKAARFKKYLEKLDRYNREILPIEGIVFKYKGKIFKMNSTFNQLNQLINILKF